MEHSKLAVVALLIVGAAVAPSSAGAEERLHQAVVPSSYDLTLEPDLDRVTFLGHESIVVNLAASRSSISLHAVDLLIGSVRARIGEQVLVGQTTLDAANQMVHIAFAEPLPAGAVELQVTFSGKLNSRLRGLYAAELGGRKYVVSQFEPTDARRAFPCFDEPAMKARFRLTAVIDHALTAISNGDPESETMIGSKKKIRFAETKPISSYLVALAVGPFERVEGFADRVPVRIYAPAGNRELSSYALKSAIALTERLGRYFEIDYPFAKLDLVAVPDFEAGGMENVGAIFCRASRLLVDEKNSSIANRRGVDALIAHEIAHQWFGDLVTLAWWDDLWLNEAFATWAGTHMLADWHPQEEVWLEFEEGENQVLEVDALANTHAIRLPIKTAEETNSIFDGITYEKGAAVIRMIERALGQEDFARGVSRYLKQHSYGNATAADLWRALEEASKKPVSALASSWIDQAGHPVREARCLGRRGALTQEREYSSGGTRRDTNVREQWIFPASISEARTVAIRIGRCTVDVPVERIGFSRMRWPASQIMIAAAVMKTPESRLSFLSDLWAQVTAGSLQVKDYLAVIHRFAGERHRTILSEVTNRFHEIDQYLVRSNERDRFRQIVSEFLSPIFAELGWDSHAGEDEETQLLRVQVIGALGRYGENAALLAEAEKRLDAYLAHRSSAQTLANAQTLGGAPASKFDDTLADAIVPLLARRANEKRYEVFLEGFRHPESPEAKVRFSRALSSVIDPLLVERSLSLIISGEMHTELWMRFLAHLFASEEARPLVWRFVQKNFDLLKSRSPEYALGRVISATAYFCDPDSAKEVRAFFTVHKVPGAERDLEEAIEQIGLCVRWKAQNRDWAAFAVR